MLHNPDPIPLEATGTVVSVRHQGTWAQVDVKWDSGRTLMLVVLPDECELLPSVAKP